MNWKVCLLGVLLPGCVIACSGQATPKHSGSATVSAPVISEKAVDNGSSATLHARAPRYRLQPGDTVDVIFTFTPEFNQSVTVQPDGFVSLNGVADVQAEGLTLDDFRGKVAQRYAPILHAPEVAVSVKDSPRNSFIVAGQVGHPGRFELRGPVTVSQAIAVAGGFTEASKHSEVWLVRGISTELVEARKLDVKRMLARGDFREDLPLQPGDMVYVPQNTISKLKSLILPRPAAGATFRY